MKKLFLAGLIGLVPTLLMAQQVAMNEKNNNAAALPAAISATTHIDNSGNTAKEARKVARETRQFARTTKAFEQDFENASDVHWSSGQSEYTAMFTKDNVKANAWYNKGGALIYSMLTYTPDKLPRREQDIVADAFGGYKATLVNEVHQGEVIVYVVHLENDRNIKLITISDGETNLYREYKKM